MRREAVGLALIILAVIFLWPSMPESYEMHDEIVSVALGTGMEVNLTGCRHVYLDMGANIGVQIRKLFEPHLYRGNKIEPYFERWFGDVLERRRDVCAVAFEPNPSHRERLQTIRDCYNTHGWRTFVVLGAVGVSDQHTLSFLSDPTGENELWASHVVADSAWADPRLRDRLTNVSEIDIARFVLRHVATRTFPNESSRRPFVAAKFDIEGAEYTAIAKLILTGAMCVIDAATVEWHRWSEGMPGGIGVAATTLLRRSSDCTRLETLDDESFMHDGYPLPC